MIKGLTFWWEGTVPYCRGRACRAARGLWAVGRLVRRGRETKKVDVCSRNRLLQGRGGGRIHTRGVERRERGASFDSEYRSALDERGVAAEQIYCTVESERGGGRQARVSTHLSCLDGSEGVSSKPCLVWAGLDTHEVRSSSCSSSSSSSSCSSEPSRIAQPCTLPPPARGPFREEKSSAPPGWPALLEMYVRA